MRKSALFVIIALGFCAASCRKDLCYNHDEHSLGVRIDVNPQWITDWEFMSEYDWQKDWPQNIGFTYDDLRHAIPDGLRGVMYNQEGKFLDQVNMPAEGGRMELQKYAPTSVLFYNNDTEYIIFDGLDQWASATATTRTRTRASYSDVHKDEETVTTPDVLFSSYIENYYHEPEFGGKATEVKMQPLVCKYLVIYEFKHGYKYVALARGAMAGMAESVYLKSGDTADKPVTLLYDCELGEDCPIATVYSFGAPSIKDGTYTKSPSDRFGLNLEVRLTNGKIYPFEFDITDQVKAQPRGGIIRVSGIEITDEQGLEGGTDFDVDVDGWGEEHDVIIDL